MELIINYSNQIDGQMIVKTNEIRYNGFIINKSFSINSVKVNGNECDYQKDFDDNHLYQIITLKKNIKDIQTIEVIYSGALDGTTGLFPYVKEKTRKDFALFRFESLCIPFFISSLEDNLHDYIVNGFNKNSKSIIKCDKELEVFSNLNLENKKIRNTTKQYTFIGTYLNFVIGAYHTKEFTFGKIHGLKNRNEELNKISDVITDTIQYMNHKYLEVM